MLNDALPVLNRRHGILVADDDADIRDVLDVELQREGFAVWLAADGREALEVLRRERPSIDLALLDVRMPGLDGPQALAAMKVLSPRIRCCFMTGYLGSYTDAGLRGLGADAVLLKPFRLTNVSQTLRAAVSTTARTDEAE